MNYMKISFLGATFLVLAITAAAQQAAPTPELYSDKTLREMESIQAAALSSDYAFETGATPIE